MEKTIKKPSLSYSLFILILMVAVISTGLILLEAPIQIMLFTAIVVLIPFVLRLGYSYEEIEKAMFASMLKALKPSLILMSVGILIGTWIASGTVPTLIYYGIQSISPQFFLVTTLLFCSVVSMATGSSWATLGTAGIAMIGVGQSLDVSLAMTAGAIVSGAYFGDKLSPLSDTTNLAAAVVGIDVFTHVKHMLWTTVPAYVLSAIIFTLIGLNTEVAAVNSAEVNSLTGYLATNFNLGIISIIPALFLFVLLITKQPAIISVFLGGVAGALIAIFYQGIDMTSILGVAYNGFFVESGIEAIDSLLQRGGLVSMLPMVAIFIFALGLGGLLNISGVLVTIIDSIIKMIKSRALLVFVTMIMSYFTLGLGGSFSFAGVMTGTFMKPLFDKFNLRPENLSRAMEDTATQGCALLPWTASGVFTATTLGVPTLTYLPFCFLAMLTPLFTFLYGLTGFSMKEEKKQPKHSTKEVPTA
ncbi:MAG: Na+/H+ antiporter NhaC [Psychrobacillus sp.]